MTMPSDQSEGRPQLQEELVAFLDGELADADHRHIEEMLTAQPQVREEVHGLERVWDLLDQLPRAEADELFAQSTVEMVAVKAEYELEQHRARQPRALLRRCLLTFVGFAAAGVLGVLAVDVLRPGPDEALLEQLPLLEQLDEYRQAGSVQFLQQLNQDRIFSDDEQQDQ